ncbi:MAG: hypothetical protein CMQ61_03250 [Gammaproteobacteria bacterium]|nr:hypothetical protein [Gammaproteobacteria bacterium]
MLIRLMVICVAWAVAHVAVSQTSAPSAQPAGVGATPAAKLAHAELDGAAIMAEQVRRHQQFPYVYEEQTMVLIDKTGHRRVRKARRYMRVEKDLSVKFLLVFLDPEEIRGVALLARRTSVGVMRNHMYLPAFGQQMKSPSGDGRTGAFLGTDFAVEDLTVEIASEFSYLRVKDIRKEGVEYFQVEAHPRNKAIGKTTSYGLRRHRVRKDNFMITQTDFYDRNLRFLKRLTYHDLKRVYGESWRANMLVMNHGRNNHTTLLKIDRRVYSRDYVPSELFEPEHLLANRHVTSAAVGKTPEATQ